MRKQKRQAIGPNGGCLYYTEDGLRCAAGCLVPDDKLQLLKDRGVNDPANYSIFKAIVGSDNIMPLRVLQNIHDEIMPYQWEEQFKIFATNHDLVYISPVDQNV